MKPNILFLLIDSLRADKCHGDKKSSILPNIDSLIQQGAYFNQAISATDGTFTSLGSILTSLLPFKTHISWFHNHSKATKFFDFLKNNGYHTYATVPNMPFFPNLTTNFDDKDITDGNPYLNLYQGAGEMIVQRISNTNKEPWIYFIHAMDLHGNELPQKEFNDEHYGSDDYERRLSSLDAWIGKILEKIDKEKTLIVLTADHGEHIHDLVMHPEYIPSVHKIFKNGARFVPDFLSPTGLKLFVAIRTMASKIRMRRYRQELNEDEMRTLIQRGAGTLYDEVLRVPLIFSGYGITSHKIIPQQVRHIDIFPTIMDLLNLPFGEVDGNSLLPHFNNEKIDELPAYIENVSAIEQSQGNTIGVRMSTYKYYRARKNPKENVTLFDLINDPDEKNNIANSNPDIVKNMEKILVGFTNNTLSESTKKLSRDEKRRSIKNRMRLDVISYETDSD